MLIYRLVNFLLLLFKISFSPKNSCSKTASLAGQISRIATVQRQGSRFTCAFFRVMFRFATSRILEYK